MRPRRQTQNRRGEAFLRPVLPQNVPDVRDSLRGFRHGKIQGLRLGGTPFPTARIGLKKNGLVPASDAVGLAKILAERPEIRDVFVDATERPVRRSSSAKNQRRDYSGKKGTHAKKNLAVTSEKRILAVGKTESGSVHDYRLLKESGFMGALVGHALWADLGFFGIRKDFPNHEVLMPEKKPKGKELSDAQKADNRVISSIRVKVEHLFARTKSWFVIANRYRNRLYGDFETVRNDRKHQVMLVVCALCNLKTIIS